MGETEQQRKEREHYKDLLYLFGRICKISCQDLERV